MQIWRPLNLSVQYSRDHEIIGFKPGEDLTEDQISTALVAAKNAMLPADREDIKRARIYCAANTSQEKESDAAKRLRIEAMIEELSKYPGDLVIDALMNWHTHSLWTPKTAEIVQHINLQYNARKSLVAALEKSKVKGTKKEYGRRWKDLTEKEKQEFDERSARVKEMLAEAGRKMAVK